MKRGFLIRVILQWILILPAFWGAGQVQAEREVHGVAVGKGQQPDHYLDMPSVDVLIDRPGQEVALVLLDGGEVQWNVDVTDGTLVTEVIRSGPSERDSQVLLSGVPMAGVQVSGLPLVYQPLGRDFRRLVDRITAEMRTPRIHSFRATYQFYGDVLRIEMADATTHGFAQNHLSGQLADPFDLPVALRDWVNRTDTERPINIEFDQAGMVVDGPAGQERYPVMGDVPEVLLPVTAVSAPQESRIFGVTYGASGFIYDVNLNTGLWSVLTDLGGYDAADALYAPQERALVLTGAFSRPGDLRIIGLDGSQMAVFIPTRAFPGYSDLYDFGNEYGPPLQPRVFADGWLGIDVAIDDGGTQRSRRYAVHVETREVRLLRYRN